MKRTAIYIVGAALFGAACGGAATAAAGGNDTAFFDFTGEAHAHVQIQTIEGHRILCAAVVNSQGAARGIDCLDLGVVNK